MDIVVKKERRSGAGRTAPSLCLFVLAYVHHHAADHSESPIELMLRVLAQVQGIGVANDPELLGDDALGLTIEEDIILVRQPFDDEPAYEPGGTAPLLDEADLLAVPVKDLPFVLYH